MIGLWCYAVIDLGTPQRPEVWRALWDKLSDRPVMLYMRQLRKRYDLPHFSQMGGRLSLSGRYYLFRFVIHADDLNELTQLLMMASTARGYTGTVKARFQALLIAEVQEALIEMGMPAIATLSIVAYDSDRAFSMREARSWITARTLEWDDYPGRGNVPN